MYKINRGVRINVVINTCAELALLAQICELPLQRYNQGGEESKPVGNQDLSSLQQSTHLPPVHTNMLIIWKYEKTLSVKKIYFFLQDSIFNRTRLLTLVLPGWNVLLQCWLESDAELPFCSCSCSWLSKGALKCLSVIGIQVSYN